MSRASCVIALSLALFGCERATQADLASDGVAIAEAKQAVSAVRPFTLLGVGDTNFGVWSYSSVTSQWNGAWQSEGVIDVAALPDGSLIGVGKDHQLYRRATLTYGRWNVTLDMSRVLSVDVMPDGLIVGVNEANGGLMKRAAFEGRDPFGVHHGEMLWHTVSSPTGLRDIAIRPDGHIYAVTNDHWIIEIPELGVNAWNWVGGFYTGSVDSIAFDPWGTLYAVDTNSHEVRYVPPGGSNWIWLPNSRGVQSVGYGSVITDYAL
jgi:hypothetical protein